MTVVFVVKNTASQAMSPVSTLSTLKYMPFSIRGKYMVLFHLSLIQRIIGIIGLILQMSSIFPQNPWISYIIPCLAYENVMICSILLQLQTITSYGYTSDSLEYPEKPLPFLKHNQKMMFQGTDLIAYKAGGLPKRGRKSKSTKRSQYPLLNLED